MSIELTESENGFTIHTKVPGFEAKDLNILVEPDTIHIHGKTQQRKEEKKGKDIQFSGIHARELCRRVDLPASLNADKASARLTNGMLEVVLPKAVPSKAIAA